MNELSPSIQAQILEFSDEKGSARSGWIAGGLVVALILWMGSGFIFPAETEDLSKNLPDKASLVSVAVTKSTATQVTQYFVAEGQATPDRATSILSEMGGRVTEVLVKKGDILQAGQPLAHFDTNERAANLESATQAQEQAQRSFGNAERLLASGSVTQDTMITARANLAASNAQLLAAQKAMEAGDILAPFSGRLEALNIEMGEYVQPDTDVAHLVDNDPLTIIIQVPQQSVRALSAGLEADIEFITGERKTGLLSFLGSNANAQTRTFLAEISVENPFGDIPAGVSVEVRIPIAQQQAHFISPGILSIGSDGVLGVKTVDEANIVVLYPVEIIRAQTDGIWVSGLPDVTRVISIGQGFVNQGETVNPQDAAVEKDPDLE